ncbi:nucleotide sugar dehydrogenase [Chloroflexota bacterium]
MEQKIKKKTALIGIVGLGYVGLPLALAFSEAGFKVLGFDIRQENVDSVNEGKSYLMDVDSKRLAVVVANKLLQATTEQSRIKDMNAICICVPTPLTKSKEPDLSYVRYESEEISKHLQPGQLIVLESTTYPGTTRDIMLPILEQSGLKAGRDFYLAYSPERVDPGSKNYNISNTPKVIGGINPLSTRLAELLYHNVAEVVVPVSSPEVAEMTKIFENVFRNVNIALVNELAQLCEKMGISVWEVIKTAATKPFGYMPFFPGPGIGGHCIPLDPYYLANKAREYDFHMRFIELAAQVNEQMPYYVASRISEALNAKGISLNRAKVLVLGVTYKRDVGDLRESPSLKLVQILCEKGATLRYHDPYVESIQAGVCPLVSVVLSDELLSLVDCVIIGTDHSCYDYINIANKASLLFDSRGATTGLTNCNIVRL